MRLFGFAVKDATRSGNPKNKQPDACRPQPTRADVGGPGCRQGGLKFAGLAFAQDGDLACGLHLGQGALSRAWGQVGDQEYWS